MFNFGSLHLTSSPSRKRASTRDEGWGAPLPGKQKEKENSRLCWKLERQQHACGNLWSQTVRWGLPGTHLTKHRGSSQSPTATILPLGTLGGRCSYYAGALHGCTRWAEGESFLRAEFIPFWKFSRPGDTCGKNVLSLADKKSNPFSPWTWTVFLGLRFWRTSLCSHQAQRN